MNDGGSLQLGDSNDSFIRFLDEVDDVLYLGTHRDGLLDLDQRVFEAGSGLVDLAVSLCDVVDVSKLALAVDDVQSVLGKTSGNGVAIGVCPCLLYTSPSPRD